MLIVAVTQKPFIMKKLSEMKIAKDAMLSDIETAVKGGYVKVGAGTNYYGPSNPTSITTYLDGMNIGSDGLSGSIGGDSWSVNFAQQGAGTMKIMSRVSTQ